jgi:hypothetical protein
MGQLTTLSHPVAPTSSTRVKGRSQLLTAALYAVLLRPAVSDEPCRACRAGPLLAQARAVRILRAGCCCWVSTCCQPIKIARQVDCMYSKVAHPYHRVGEGHGALGVSWGEGVLQVTFCICQ